MSKGRNPSSSTPRPKAQTALTEPRVGANESILFICTGNVCRSPFLEYELRRQLGSRSSIMIESAGTAPLPGHTIAEAVAARLSAQGTSAARHRARAVTRPMLDQATLVLTAARSHAAAVIALSPAAAKKTFTVAQFARLLALGDPAPPHSEEVGAHRTTGVTAAMLRASRNRGRSRARPDEDDIEDPWGQPAAVYELVLSRLDEVISVLAPALGRPNPKS